MAVSSVDSGPGVAPREGVAAAALTRSLHWAGGPRLLGSFLSRQVRGQFCL